MIFGKETNISAVICSNGLIQVERNLHGFHRGVLASKGGWGLIIQNRKNRKMSNDNQRWKVEESKVFFYKKFKSKEECLSMLRARGRRWSKDVFHLKL